MVVEIVIAVTALVIAILSHIRRSRCWGGCFGVELNTRTESNNS